MRLVIQKVKQASVSVQGTQISKIGKGFLVLLGITHNDNEEYVKKYVEKLLHLQAWPKIQEKNGELSQKNEEEKVSDSIPLTSDEQFCSNLMENDYEVIVVSQFTLYGKLKGTKPDFHDAMNSEEAEALYKQFVDLLKKAYKADKIQTGKFGNRMAVDILNDGPFMLVWDSQKE